MNTLFCVTLVNWSICTNSTGLRSLPRAGRRVTHEPRNQRAYPQTRITEGSIYNGDVYNYKEHLDTGVKMASYKKTVSNTLLLQDRKRCELSNVM